MASTKKGLGRGLSALIPDEDMDFLSRVARGDESVAPVAVAPVAAVPENKKTTASSSRKKPKNAVSGPTLPIETGETSSEADAGGGDTSPVEEFTASDSGVSDRAVAWLNPQEIEPNPFQPRRTFSESEMESLADSIREHGILQPILVRLNPKSGDSEAPRYQLVAGERRWRAAQRAGVETVPVIIRAVEDQQALELALIENVQRHDISPLDTALAYKRLSADFHLSQEEIARRVGKSRPAVANTLRLLELPEEVQTALDDQSLSEGHGRAILLAEGEAARRAVFRRILRDRLSVREAEEIARAVPRDVVAPEGGEGTDGAADERNADIAHLEETLQRALGRRVQVRVRKRGGFLMIPYADQEDLSQLVERFRQAK